MTPGSRWLPPSPEGSPFPFSGGLRGETSPRAGQVVGAPWQQEAGLTGPLAGSPLGLGERVDGSDSRDAPHGNVCPGSSPLCPFPSSPRLRTRRPAGHMSVFSLLLFKEDRGKGLGVSRGCGSAGPLASGQ